MKFIEKLLSKNSYNNKEKKTAVSIGALGEEAAALVLRKKGYKIIERNYRSKMGEIDIIAKDGEYTCFVEVRLRKNNSYGSPADSINEGKRRRIIRTAQLYAMEKGIFDTPMRFDVVLINAVAKENSLKNVHLEIIKDAFRL